MPLRIDPHSSGQLGRHVEHHLAITHQALRQPSARAMASLHRPSAICPAASELPQPAIAASTIHKPLTGNHRLSDRIHHRQRVARLVWIDADHHIVAHRHRLLDRSRQTASRGGQCNYRQRKPLNSHNPAGGPGKPQAVREPERQTRRQPISERAHRAQHLRLLPQAPNVESNKLPTMCGRPGRDQPGRADVLCGSHAAFAGRRSSCKRIRDTSPRRPNIRYA